METERGLPCPHSHLAGVGGVAPPGPPAGGLETWAPLKELSLSLHGHLCGGSS